MKEQKIMTTKPLAILTIALAFGMPFATAQSKDISGQWSGAGYAHLASGQKENVRCRVTYNRESSKVFEVNAVCASPSLRIWQTRNVLKATKNTYVGNLHNDEFDISARVRIVVRGSRQSITMRAGEGSGKLTLRRR